MTTDSPSYKLGEMVYHKTEDTPGVIVGLLYKSSGLLYQVSWQGRLIEEHDGIELTTERPYFTNASSQAEEA
jgi:hypothetical protein